MADQDSIPSQALIAPRNSPGLTAVYGGKYRPKSPEYGVQRFAYRTGVSPTAFSPGSAYSSYTPGQGQQ